MFSNRTPVAPERTASIANAPSFASSVDIRKTTATFESTARVRCAASRPPPGSAASTRQRSGRCSRAAAPSSLAEAASATAAKPFPSSRPLIASSSSGWPDATMTVRTASSGARTAWACANVPAWLPMPQSSLAPGASGRCVRLDRIPRSGGPGETRSSSALAHETLAGGADERDRLGEEHAHRIAQGERLLVGAALDGDLRERGGRQLDGGVQRQRGELLALRLLHRLGLLLGELAKAAQQILGVAAEGKSESAAFHPFQASAARPGSRARRRGRTRRPLPCLPGAPPRTARSGRRARARARQSRLRARRGTPATRRAAAARSPARAPSRPPPPPRFPPGAPRS